MASHCCRLISECYWNAKAPGTRIDGGGEREGKRKRPARKGFGTIIQSSGHPKRVTFEVFVYRIVTFANRWNEETDYIRSCGAARPDPDRYTKGGATPAPLASTAPLIDS